MTALAKQPCKLDSISTSARDSIILEWETLSLEVTLHWKFGHNIIEMFEHEFKHDMIHNWKPRFQLVFEQCSIIFGVCSIIALCVAYMPQYQYILQYIL